ncbi:MAG: DUF2336 domain-containing protein [Hyphomicrobiales bacterium]|nr:DUF2336 domain-containing protein [Hyphomicrobiales bacterium]
MIIRRFLLWARTASAADRAVAVRLLVDAYLHSPMSPEDKRDAETAMLSLLDDPSALVRSALAEALAGEKAPRAVVLGLMQDQSDIAVHVLATSPMLCEADLIDAAAIGDDQVQCAIARRNNIDVPLAAALVEVGEAGAVAVLLANDAARIAPGTLQRAVERFGNEPQVREALLARQDTPCALRHRLAVEVAASLTRWLGDCGLMNKDRAERVARESTEKVAVRLAGCAHPGMDELEALVLDLRAGNRLTPGLILRSLLTGETALAEAALAQLAGMPMARASNIIHDRRGAGVAALCRKAEIPPTLIPAFVAAIDAVRETGAVMTGVSEARRSRRIVERVLIACETADSAQDAALLALLRRFEADAAREEAFELAQSMADDAALSSLLEIDPELTLLADHGAAPQDAMRLAA